MASFLRSSHWHFVFKYPVLRHETITTSLPGLRLITINMLNAKNKVPEHQRLYQAAYKAHNRLWMIGSRSRLYMTPYLIVLWGTFGATFYAAGRKITGHNTWFGKD